MDSSVSTSSSVSTRMTSEEMLERGSTWTLRCDNALLNRLKDFSENLVTQAQEISHDCDSLGEDVSLLHSQVHNVTNQFLMLSNTQFVENRVEEFVETMNIDSNTREAPVKTKAEKEAELISKMKEAIQIGVAAKTEKENKRIETGTGTFNSTPLTLNLPYIIGSSKFFSSRYCGLADDTKSFVQATQEGAINSVNESQEVSSTSSSSLSYKPDTLATPASQQPPTFIRELYRPPSINHSLDQEGSVSSDDLFSSNNRPASNASSNCNLAQTQTDAKKLPSHSNSVPPVLINKKPSIVDDLNSAIRARPPPPPIDSDESDYDFKPPGPGQGLSRKVFADVDDEDDDLFGSNSIFASRQTQDVDDDDSFFDKPPPPNPSNLFSQYNPHPPAPVFYQTTPPPPIPTQRQGSKPRTEKLNRTLFPESPTDTDDEEKPPQKPWLPAGAVSMFSGLPPPVIPTHSSVSGILSGNDVPKVQSLTPVAACVISQPESSIKTEDSAGTSQVNSVNSKTFTNELAQATAATQIKSGGKSSSIFDEDSDEDLFSASNNRSNKKPVTTFQKTDSLFGETSHGVTVKPKNVITGFKNEPVDNKTKNENSQPVFPSSNPGKSKPSQEVPTQRQGSSSMPRTEKLNRTLCPESPTGTDDEEKPPHKPWLPAGAVSMFSGLPPPVIPTHSSVSGILSGNDVPKAQSPTPVAASEISQPESSIKAEDSARTSQVKSVNSKTFTNETAQVTAATQIKSGVKSSSIFDEDSDEDLFSALNNKSNKKQVTTFRKTDSLFGETSPTVTVKPKNVITGFKNEPVDNKTKNENSHPVFPSSNPGKSKSSQQVLNQRQGSKPRTEELNRTLCPESAKDTDDEEKPPQKPWLPAGAVSMFSGLPPPVIPTHSSVSGILSGNDVPKLQSPTPVAAYVISQPESSIKTEDSDGTPRVNSVNSKTFTNELAQATAATQIKSGVKSSSIFDEDSDEDLFSASNNRSKKKQVTTFQKTDSLFGETSPTVTVKPKNVMTGFKNEPVGNKTKNENSQPVFPSSNPGKSKPSQQQKSIFDESDSDSDIFSSKSSSAKKSNNTKPSGGKLFQSKTKQKSNGKSIFGNDSDEDMFTAKKALKPNDNQSFAASSRSEKTEPLEDVTTSGNVSDTIINHPEEAVNISDVKQTSTEAHGYVVSEDAPNTDSEPRWEASVVNHFNDLSTNPPKLLTSISKNRPKLGPNRRRPTRKPKSSEVACNDGLEDSISRTPTFDGTINPDPLSTVQTNGDVDLFIDSSTEE